MTRKNKTRNTYRLSFSCSAQFHWTNSITSNQIMHIVICTFKNKMNPTTVKYSFNFRTTNSIFESLNHLSNHKLNFRIHQSIVLPVLFICKDFTKLLLDPKLVTVLYLLHMNWPSIWTNFIQQSIIYKSATIDILWYLNVLRRKKNQIRFLYRVIGYT